jgi:ribosome-associated protein
MDPLRINDHITIPAWELWYTASRSGGAGGQHVNTTSSRVTLCWAPGQSSALTEGQRARVCARLAARIGGDGVLQLHVDENRSQHRNLEIARERLADLVVDALRVAKRRVPTRVPRSAERNRLEDKGRRSAIKRARRGPGSGDGET